MRIHGFYGVVDGGDLPAPAGAQGPLVAAAVALADALLAGGATVLQVRMKHAPASALLAVARALREPTRAAGALLVVNDRLDVALAADADGVHLGQDDLSLADARAALARAGRTLFIGSSTHTPAQAEAAVRAGADYLGFGPVFATGTKEQPDPVQGLAALAEAVRRAHPVPVVAIGGIDAERARLVADAGAAAACAIAFVNRAADPAAAGRRVAAAFR